jgi:hypothetical protein
MKRISADFLFLPKDKSALFFLFDPREKKIISQRRQAAKKPPLRLRVLSAYRQALRAIKDKSSAAAEENRKTPIAGDVNFYTFGFLDLFL